MKWTSWWLRAVLLLLLIVSAAQLWLLQRMHTEMERLSARLIPQGELRYQAMWPFLWGEARVWGLSFQPEGLLKLSMRTPPGFRVTVRELRIEDWRLGAHGELEFLRGRLRGLRFPIADANAAGTSSTRLARARLPTLAELGFPVLELDVRFTSQYLRAADLAVISIDSRSNVWGQAQASVHLQGTPAAFLRSQDQLLLRKLQIDLPDHLRLHQLKQSAARAQGVSTRAGSPALALGLQQRARTERWDWSPGSLSAMQQALRESRSLQITLAPPDDFLLRDLRMHKAANWSRELGFGLRAPAPPEADDADAR
ncbi:MAG: hypothetical protein ACT4PG_00185 [Panacagrimonas sp.]